MRYQIEETHRHTPSVVESAAQKMRNAGLLTAAVFEALGFNLQDIDMIKKG